MRSRLVRYVILALAAPFAVLGLASPAAAVEPTGEYAVFKQCPLSLPFLNSCVYSLTTSGSVTIASTTVPIVNPIVFQGGETREVIGEQEFRKFVPPANGEVLSNSPQPVPGGLAGLIKCSELTNPAERLICEVVFQNGLTGVNVNTEIVGEAQYSILKLASHKVGLVMPVRVRLENPLLGNNCYIGSASEPITLRLTTGTTNPPPPNQPITGFDNGITIKDGGGLVVAEHVSAVDNSFSVPTANGCGAAGLLSSVIDPIINLKLGLPSAAGNNTAILNGKVKQAGWWAVRENEGLPLTSSTATASGVSGEVSAPSTSSQPLRPRGNGVHVGTFANAAHHLK